MANPTREDKPDWIWPRADSHVVLGAEGSPDVLKTFVEPGASFSPGVGSFGVSVWVWLEDERRLVAPEQLPREEIRDRLLGGILPICRSRWRAGSLEIDIRLSVEPCPDEHHVLNTVSFRAVNRGRRAGRAWVLLVVRSVGPAGGPLRSIAYNHEIRGFLIHDGIRVVGRDKPVEAGCVSLADDGHDLSVPLQRGDLPRRLSAFDADGYCGGYLAYHIALEPGGEWWSGWDFPVLPGEPEPTQEMWRHFQVHPRDRLEIWADRCRERLTPVTIDVPDARIHEAFHASLTHLMMAMVGDEPRVATICYPLFWVRDGVYIINALDKGGLSDLAERAADVLAKNLWGGGFGPEADAPGEALWCLGEHHRLSGDDEWLVGVYPQIRERVEWILRMRRADAPIRLPTVNVLPRTRLHPEHDLLCEAAADGLIVGRMDWHRPLFWVNAFALAGLRAAARMATVVGEQEDAEAWGREAEELAQALESRGVRFGSNERDLACAIWPTEARRPDDPETLEMFERWWTERRLDRADHYHREPRWRYFELGQAHNYLRLGMRDCALVTIEQFLRTQDAPGQYAWGEGDPTGDPSGDWRLIRGWWPERTIVPHGWASAEMALLLRDLFVFEEDDHLVLGAGIRPEWLNEPGGLGISVAPTHHGKLTWRLEPYGSERAYVLTISCLPGPPPGGYRIRLPLPPSANVEFEGAGVREDEGDWPIAAKQTAITVTISLP